MSKNNRTINFQKEQKPVNVPLWREVGLGIDWFALRCSPIYYGLGAQKGDKSGVIVVPGFLASDASLLELYYWLERVGYQPYMSDIGRVVDCFDVMVERLKETINKAYNETGRKIHLIGHSLGGMLARAAATQRPEQVASVITLGSPFRGLSSHLLVLGLGNLVQANIKVKNRRPDYPNCMTASCNCAGFKALAVKFPADKVMQTAIYTPQDGVVDWRNCLSDDPTANFKVISTHCGLAFNPFVYDVLAKRLKLSVLTEQQLQKKNVA
jgi:pimeloyl-ACP methyl ester carboxylesterase